MRGLGVRGRLLQEGSLYLLLVLLPFSKAAIEIAFGFLLLGWILERLDPRTRRETLWVQAGLRPLGLLLAGYLGLCALSVTVSRFPDMSLWGLINKWLEYLWFFVMATDLGSRPAVLRRSLWALTCSAFLVVVEGVSQEWLGRGLFRSFSIVTFQRMTGPYENPIDLATYVMVVIPVLAGFAVSRRGRGPRLLLWGLLGLLTACFIRTNAFGAWLSLGLGLGTILLTMAQTRRYVLMAAVLGILAMGMAFQQTRRLPEALSPSELSKVDRWMMWQAALGMIHDHPVLGSGVNTFMAHYLDYWVGGEQQPRYAHNCYLQMAAEIGVVGLTAFVAVLWSLGALLWSGVSRARPGERAVRLGFAVGLLAFAVQAGYDTNFYSLRQAVLFWVAAGLALGFSQPRPWQRGDGRGQQAHAHR